MSDFSRRISSSLKLGETESACEVEQSGGLRLDMIKFGTFVDNGKVFTINVADYFFESSFKILNDLHFVEVKDDDDAKKTTDDKKKSGWIPICDSEIYVEDQLKRVLVFGKKS